MIVLTQLSRQAVILDRMGEVGMVKSNWVLKVMMTDLLIVEHCEG